MQYHHKKQHTLIKTHKTHPSNNSKHPRNRKETFTRKGNNHPPTILSTSPLHSGIALLISLASTSRKPANASFFPRRSWFPRCTSSTNSRV